MERIRRFTSLVGLESGLILLLVALSLLFGFRSYATIVNLRWDINAESDLAGYKLYGSQYPDSWYSYLKSYGLVSSGTVDVEATHMYFKLSAFDQSGNESSLSEYALWAQAPLPATNGRIISEEVTGMAWPSDWGRKVKIDVQASLADSNLSYFTILITEDCIPSEVLDTTSGNEAQADGGDLRFYTGDYSGSNPATENTDRIPCEIVSFTRAAGAGGTCQIWVRVPTINSSTGATITMFYNATGKSQPAVGATYGRNETWDENGSDNYKRVYHAEESSTPSVDSTGNTDGTWNGNTAQDSGAKIGDGLDFDGTTDFIDGGNDAGLDAQNLTMSGWFNPDDSTDCYIFGRTGDSGASPNYTILCQIYSNATYASFGIGGSDRDYSAAWTPSTSTWTYIAVRYDQSYITLFDAETKRVNQNYGAGTVATGTDYYITVGAKKESGNFGYDGQADEIRYSVVARSDAWLAAEYRSVNAPATYVVEGTPSDVGAAADPEGPLIGGKLIKGGILQGRLL